VPLLPEYPDRARRRYTRSTQVARRGVTAARAAKGRGLAAVAREVTLHQVVNAQLAEDYVDDVLAEQGIAAEIEADLNLLAFTTEAENLGRMLDAAADDAGIDRLVESLVQDAGRAAEQVATAARPRIGHVRILTPPSCSRCVVLAGRVYRWSEGFERHPGDDCVSMPTTLVNPDLVIDDPLDLLEAGLITDLSEADSKALRDGADLGKVVNVRRQAAGLHTAGRAITRRGRLTPEGVYAAAGDDRDTALQLLEANGYIVRRRAAVERVEPVELPIEREVIEVRAPVEPADMTEAELEAELERLMAAEDYDRAAAVGEELDRRSAPPAVEVPVEPDPVVDQEALNQILFGQTEIRDLTAERRAGGRDVEKELRDEWETWVHMQWIRAEEETRGVMLTARAEAAGVSALDLFTRRLRSLEYASPELQEWFAQPGNERMSFPEFRAGRMDDKKAREARARTRNRGFESEYG
jgi:hypothetical protein